MNFDNYTKEEKIIDLMKANLVAIKYFAFFAVVFGLPYLFVWGFNSNPLLKSDNIFLKYLSLPVMLILGVVLHELIHGIFFAKYAQKGVRSVKFGVMWKALAPYAHCKEPLKIKEYKVALVAPLILVGILPAIIGIITGSSELLILGIAMSGGAAGDLMIYDLIKKENPEDYVQDHPSEAGYFIFREKSDSLAD